MKTVKTIIELQAAVNQARIEGKQIALIPTMGNLHAGHIALVNKAVQRADFVVVSVFVNPLQFSATEDLSSYPSTPEEDKQKLVQSGCNLMFLPSAKEIYPHGMTAHTQVHVPIVSEGLCSTTRPGHMDGVATVVSKLFHMVQPNVAFFGQKDFQQLRVICKLVDDLNMPIQVVGEPTIRADDGLALSSRNRYLTTSERATAPMLYQSLQSIALAIQADRTQINTILDKYNNQHKSSGFKLDYLEVRQAKTLAPFTKEDTQLVVLIAAFLGRARLIDNLIFSLD